MKKEITYDPEYFASLFQAEDQHFWFVSRNRLISSVVNNELSADGEKNTILEIGCGTGNVLKALVRSNPLHQVIGMDLYREGLLLAQERGNFQTIQADIFQSPFSSSIRVAGLFDVLEHFQEDELVLRQVNRMLVSGGSLVLTVPAFQSLWSYFDEEAHHARRYHIEDLRIKIERAGFRVKYLSYYMMSLFPFVWLSRRVSRPAWPGNQQISADANRKRVENELRIIPVANQLVRSILNMEIKMMSQGWHLPFGTSIIAVAEKIE